MPSRSRRPIRPWSLPSIVIVDLPRMSLGEPAGLDDSQHPAVGGVVRTGLGEVVECAAGDLDDVGLYERSPLRRPLLAVLEAAFPFQDGPAVEAVAGPQIGREHV